jgi:hypothetical protein
LLEQAATEQNIFMKKTVLPIVVQRSFFNVSASSAG